MGNRINISNTLGTWSRSRAPSDIFPFYLCIHSRKRGVSVNIYMWGIYVSTGFDNWRTSRTYVRLILLAYAWYLTCVRWHVRSFFSYNFLKFSEILWFLFCTVLKTSCYIFDLGKDRFFTAYICFRLKKIYFSIFHTNCLINISTYLRALTNLGSQ